MVMLKAALVPSSMNHTETELVTERGFLETGACAGTGEMAYCIKSLLASVRSRVQSLTPISKAKCGDTPY